MFEEVVCVGEKFICNGFFEGMIILLFNYCWNNLVKIFDLFLLIKFCMINFWWYFEWNFRIYERK